MPDQHMHAKEFIVGAAVGSLLGGIAALMTAPKSGQKLRQQIRDSYHDLSDRTHEIGHQVARKSQQLGKQFQCQSCGWVDKARSLMGGYKGHAVVEDEEATDAHVRDLIIGGLVGGILGAVAGLLIAPKPGEALRQDLVDSYHDASEKSHAFANDVTKRGKVLVKNANAKAHRWIDLAKDVIEEFTDEVEEGSEQLVSKAKKAMHSSRLDEVAEWASLGLRLWQKLRGNSEE